MPLAVDTPADIANVIRICRQHHRTLAELTDNRGHRLVAGLDAQRSVGVLALQEDPSQPELVPVAGTHNTVEYEDWYGSVLPSREVPIELVERAIREFHETDARPACVAWETPATA
jgi:hypothetical protein